MFCGGYWFDDDDRWACNLHCSKGALSRPCFVVTPGWTPMISCRSTWTETVPSRAALAATRQDMLTCQVPIASSKPSHAHLCSNACSLFVLSAFQCSVLMLFAWPTPPSLPLSPPQACSRSRVCVCVWWGGGVRAGPASTSDGLLVKWSAAGMGSACLKSRL